MENEQQYTLFKLKHVANIMEHLVIKETITNFKNMIFGPITKETWLQARIKELAR